MGRNGNTLRNRMGHFISSVQLYTKPDAQQWRVNGLAVLNATALEHGPTEVIACLKYGFYLEV